MRFRGGLALFFGFWYSILVIVFGFVFLLYLMLWMLDITPYNHALLLNHIVQTKPV